MSDRRQFAALRSPDLRRLLGSALIYRSGFWMSTVVFQAQLTLVAGADAVSLGILGFCNLAPIIPFSPLGGMLADRYSRRAIMVSSQAAMGLVAAVLAVVAALDAATSPTLLYAFAALFGIGMAINGPAFQALTVNVAPVDAMHSAVSMSGIVTNLTRLAGPAAGGIVVSVLGVVAGFAIYAATSLIASALFFRLRSGRAAPSQERTGVPASNGLAFVLGSRVIVTSLVLVAACAVFGSSLTLLMAAFAPEAFGTTGVEFVWLITAIGLGALVGTGLILFATRVPRLDHACWGSAIFGATLLGLGSSQTLVTGIAASMAVGASMFYVVTALNIVIQYNTPEAMRGRVMGMFMVSWAGLMPVGALAMGVLGGTIGMRRVVLVAGFLVIVVSALAARGTRSSISKKPDAFP